MKLKQKVKSFFKTRQSSESAVELLRMFILPFLKLWDSRAEIDDAIAAFFAMNDRQFYYGTALHRFKMPGYYMLAGNRKTVHAPARLVTKGQKMLFAVDRVDQTARVDIKIAEKECTFLLSRSELEVLKDHITTSPA